MRPISLLAVHCAAALALAACATAEPPPPESLPAKQACLVESQLFEPGPARDEAFSAMDTARRADILLGLPGCLNAPAPEIRDRYAFEVLSLILRSGGQTEETVRELQAKLTDQLAHADEDPNGFQGPFSILALAEVARVDRRTPFLSEEERSDLLAIAAAYLEGLTDYRGFSDTEGWRHGVAHSADLLMQMSLNPHLTRPQAEAILAAVALKAGPSGHAYIFGESERLAAPVLYLAARHEFSFNDWTEWFVGLWPAEDPLRENLYGSEAALTKLHNLRALAQTIYVSAVASNEGTYDPLAQAAFQFLSQLP